MQEAANKGYLREAVRVFRLQDQRELSVQAHYHEFDKLLLMLGGRVEYTVEGVVYELRRGDVLLIRHHDVHRPVLRGDGVYERVILWIRPESLQSEGVDLEESFAWASERRQALYHPTEECWQQLQELVKGMESSGETPMAALMRRCCFLLLMGRIHRLVSEGGAAAGTRSKGGVESAMRYINAHLSEELSVERLAALCYMSRYHFMRRFKDAAGYTVHQYIQLKRLTRAGELLTAGKSAGAAAAECGFGEYSGFLRAFRRHYGVSPGAYARGERQEQPGHYRE